MMRSPSKWALAVRKPDGDIAEVSTRSRAPWRGASSCGCPWSAASVALGESLAIGFRALAISANVRGSAGGRRRRGADGDRPRRDHLLLRDRHRVRADAVQGHAGADHELAADRHDERLRDRRGPHPRRRCSSATSSSSRCCPTCAASSSTTARSTRRSTRSRRAGADPERVKRFSLIHPRCGTAFLLWVMVIAIFVFAFLGPAELVLADREPHPAAAGDRRARLRADPLRGQAFEEPRRHDAARAGALAPAADDPRADARAARGLDPGAQGGAPVEEAAEPGAAQVESRSRSWPSASGFAGGRGRLAGHDRAGSRRDHGVERGSFASSPRRASRVGDPEGETSPEELVAAAHAACFAMSLAGQRRAPGGATPSACAWARGRHRRGRGQGHRIVSSTLTARAPAGIGEDALRRCRSRCGCRLSRCRRSSAAPRESPSMRVLEGGVPDGRAKGRGDVVGEPAGGLRDDRVVGSGAFGPLAVSWKARSEDEHGGQHEPGGAVGRGARGLLLMALSGGARARGHRRESLSATATVTFVPGEGVTKSVLDVEGVVPGDRRGRVPRGRGGREGELPDLARRQRRALRDGPPSPPPVRDHRRRSLALAPWSAPGGAKARMAAPSS